MFPRSLVSPRSLMSLRTLMSLMSLMRITARLSSHHHSPAQHRLPKPRQPLEPGFQIRWIYRHTLEHVLSLISHHQAAAWRWLHTLART